MKRKKLIYKSEFKGEQGKYVNLQNDLCWLQNRYHDLNYEVERLREKYARDEKFAKYFIFWVVVFALFASLTHLVFSVSYWYLMFVPLLLVVFHILYQNFFRGEA